MDDDYHAGLLAKGEWRADRHAAGANVRGIAPDGYDSQIWHTIDLWTNRLAVAAEQVQREGETIESAGGQLVQNPAAKGMKDATVELRALWAIVGAGPLYRARLQGPDRSADSAASDDGLPPAAVRHG